MFVINKNFPIGVEAKSNLWGDCVFYCVYIICCSPFLKTGGAKGVSGGYQSVKREVER